MSDSLDLEDIPHPGPGHNSGSGDADAAGAKLRQFIERIEHLELEKQEIADQIKEVKAEAKAEGYEVKAIMKIIALRKKDPDQLAEMAAVLELYASAIGMDMDLFAGL